LALGVAHFVMLPWRVYRLAEVGDLWWVSTANLTAQSSLAPEKDDFVAVGGGRLACEFEPSYCGKTDTSLFYKAFFAHTSEWYGRKIALLDDYWYSPLRQYIVAVPSNRRAPPLRDKIVNSILILAVIVPPMLLLTVLRNRSFQMYFWILSS